MTQQPHDSSLNTLTRGYYPECGEAINPYFGGHWYAKECPNREAAKVPVVPQAHKRPAGDLPEREAARRREFILVGRPRERAVAEQEPRHDQTTQPNPGPTPNFEPRFHDAAAQPFFSQVRWVIGISGRGL